MSVVTIGYFSIMNRLKVDNFLVPPSEGLVGTLLTPVLTADTVLVGTRLSAIGIEVEGYFGHPGRGIYQKAAIDFIKSKFSFVKFGDFCGTPFELQLINSNGRYQWYSDPNPCLQSITRLKIPRSSIKRQFIYIDAFAWLEPYIMPLIPSTNFGCLFINFGNIELANLPVLVAKWCQNKSCDRLIVQASSGGLRVEKQVSYEIIRLSISAGADIVILTFGEFGLIVANALEISEALPSNQSLLTDTSGAGAAVSATILQEVIQNSTTDPNLLAACAVYAGTKQCEVHGPLDAKSELEWIEKLNNTEQID